MLTLPRRTSGRHRVTAVHAYQTSRDALALWMELEERERAVTAREAAVSREATEQTRTRNQQVDVHAELCAWRDRLVVWAADLDARETRLNQLVAIEVAPAYAQTSDRLPHTAEYEIISATAPVIAAGAAPVAEFIEDEPCLDDPDEDDDLIPAGDERPHARDRFEGIAMPVPDLAERFRAVILAAYDERDRAAIDQARAEIRDALADNRCPVHPGESADRCEQGCAWLPVAGVILALTGGVR